MWSARARVGAAFALATCAFACRDAPSLAGGGAAANACAPLADPATKVTSEALTADGLYVVVLGSGGAARVFYGISAHLVEGVITKTTSGCAFEVDFDVEGRAYAATFSPDPARCMIASHLTSGDSPGPSVDAPLTVLTVAGEPADAGDAGVAASPASLMFFCR